MCFCSDFCSFLEFSGGSYGGGGSSDLQMQEMPDTIFVQGLGEDITDSALATYFGSIGVIKVKFSDRMLVKYLCV